MAKLPWGFGPDAILIIESVWHRVSDSILLPLNRTGKSAKNRQYYQGFYLIWTYFAANGKIDIGNPIHLVPMQSLPLNCIVINCYRSPNKYPMLNCDYSAVFRAIVFFYLEISKIPFLRKVA
jgi:hypothetical protein